MVFLGGLHRSGTSLLFRLLRQHPLVSGFEGTGVPEDEGQHLQTVFPTAKALGGEGRFGFHAGAHMVEVPEGLARATAATLFEQWQPHWDLDCPVLVEKSPPNLVRMRFLQSLFPGARFVVITRHPLEVALAERKRVGHQTVWSLIRHWATCHDLCAADAAQIGQLLTLRYEDLVRDPGGTLERLLGFLELPAAREVAVGEVSTAASDRYRTQWARLANNRLYRPYAGLLVRHFEDDANRHGYSMREFAPSAPPSAPAPASPAARSVEG